MSKPRIRLDATRAHGLFRFVYWTCEGQGVRAFGLTPYLAWLHWARYLNLIDNPQGVRTLAMAVAS